ncbi:hypothetical protein H9P43_007849 [Blastocladiella emersonii ATCC 22665]|nr:hypothetical protein H9P43_007849 [Blastocladiella emersonii ATCC 22665]
MNLHGVHVDEQRPISPLLAPPTTAATKAAAALSPADARHSAAPSPTPSADGSTAGGTSGETHDLVLPHQHDELPQIAVDVGGSLAKVVYFVPSGARAGGGGRIHFAKFETEQIESCVAFVQQLLEDGARRCGAGAVLGPRVVQVTGGGAFKFYDLFVSRLGPGVQIVKQDEMECLVDGVNFLLRDVPYEVFTYSEPRRPPPSDRDRPEPTPAALPSMHFEPVQSAPFPYMLVNIGSGVSILKVTGEGAYERVSGTSLGGGTFWGLLSLLTDADSFDEMLELALRGNNANADMLVGDIYGTHYTKLGLDANIIASSFGKVFRLPKDQRKAIDPADLARSLLIMLANNVGQIAHMCAQAHGISRIYFGGCFIRGHPITMAALSRAVEFWSAGTSHAYFLRHEGFLGAFGAFLRHRPATSKRRSFYENFTVNSRIGADAKWHAMGVLDAADAELVPFPKLLPGYTPDTFALARPSDQRYWIDLLDQKLPALVNLAVRWNRADPLIEERAAEFARLFRSHLDALRIQPSAYGELTVRGLLDLREQCLREAGFEDLFYNVKQAENELALLHLPQLLHEADKLSADPAAQLVHLLGNALAGNVYDWGCNELVGALAEGSIDFTSARSRVRIPDPALNANARAEFAAHAASGAYRHVVLFPDNSGADVVLGVLPLARWFAARGAHVVVAANSVPAINDVTHVELVRVLAQAADADAELARAVEDGRLRVVPSGSASPCIDLTRVDEEAAQAASDADLVVLVGMGRAIHTNFHARMACDVLKVAVFKNEATAQVLGFRNFDGIVKWDRAVGERE